MAKFPEMNWDYGNTTEEFKLFKQKMELCLLDQNVTEDDKAAVKIKIAIGNEGLKRINASGLTDDEQKDPEQIWTFFEGQLQISVNFRIHRLEFMQYRQKAGELLDIFITRCRQKAKDCQFEDDELAERILELVIASTKFEGFQRELLDKEKGYSIADLLRERRKYEAVAAGKECLESLENSATVNEFKKFRSPCKNCGRKHEYRQCPTYPDTCRACGMKGHWEKYCRQGKTQGANTHGRKHSSTKGNADHRQKHTYRRRKESKSRSSSDALDTITCKRQYQTDNETCIQFDAITVSSLCLDKREEAYTDVDIICPAKQGKHTLKLKIDTGAGANTLPLRTLKQMYSEQWMSHISDARVRLTAYNGTDIPCLGTISIACRYKGSQWSSERFYVVDVPGPAIMGLKTCEALRVVTIHTCEVEDNKGRRTFNSIEQLKEAYPQQFDQIGNFHTKATLHLKDDAKPSIDAPRKFPVHLRNKMKDELHKMDE